MLVRLRSLPDACVEDVTAGLRIPTHLTVRRDRTLGARITLSNRRIDWFGFSPRITLRHERRDSNLDLYDFTRTVGEFSLIRTF